MASKRERGTLTNEISGVQLSGFGVFSDDEEFQGEDIREIAKRNEMRFIPGTDGDLDLPDLVSSKTFHVLEIGAAQALPICGNPNGMVVVFAGGMAKKPKDFMLGDKRAVYWLNAMEWLQILSAGEDTAKMRLSKNWLHSFRTLTTVLNIFDGNLRISVRVKIFAFGMDPCKSKEWRPFIESLKEEKPDVYKEFLEYARFAAQGLCDSAPPEVIPGWAKKTAQSWAVAQLAKRGQLALLPPWYNPVPAGQWVNELAANLNEWEEGTGDREYRMADRK